MYTYVLPQVPHKTIHQSYRLYDAPNYNNRQRNPLVVVLVLRIDTEQSTNCQVDVVLSNVFNKHTLLTAAAPTKMAKIIEKRAP